MIYRLAGICFTDQAGLAFQHDPRIVALSWLIAFLGGFGALEMIDRARGGPHSRRRLWQIGAAGTLGAGIWAMHFVGILAILTPLPVDLAPGPTLLSLAVVIIASAIGVQLCFAGRPTQMHFACGGAIIGIGIIAMHYVGMAAMDMEGPIAYHPGPWLVSAAIAISAPTSALFIARKLRRKWQRAVAAAVLASGICGMHYTGMYGAVGLFQEEWAASVTAFSREILASTVAGTSGALLLLVLVLAAADRREAALNAAVKRAEAANREARRAESRLAAAIEAIPEGFVLFDADDRIVLCNTRYREMYNIEPALAAPGVKFETVVRYMAENGYYAIDEENIEAWIENRLRLHRNCDGHRFYQNVADGRCVQVQEKRTADGDIVGIRVDVTEARHREAAERDREKLSALGQLAGGVAHEINNLLQPILTLPDDVLDRLPAEDRESFEDLSCVQQAAQKIRDIVRSILLYARKEDPQLAELDVVAELRAALGFVNGLIPPSVRLRAVDLGLLHHFYAAANKTQLTQVITNLVVNAAQAMNGTGTVTVSTAVASLSADQAAEMGVEPGRDFVAISVADTGAGMDETVRARVFEPFFTTKLPGQGTGLGLSVADGILRSWRGAITVRSTVGKGTTFVMYVPLSRPVGEVTTSVAEPIDFADSFVAAQ